MTIDPQKLVSRLLEIADRYADERANKKSVARTIAKAKQEAILEAIREVELVANVHEPPNPWRYFTTVYPGCIVRTKPGEQSRYYLDNNDGYDCELDFEWWNQAAQCGDIFREITEDEAVSFLGGKRPWDAAPTDNNPST